MEAGSDLEMPTPGLDSARQIVAAVKEGRLKESAVDECVDRLLEAAFTLVRDKAAQGGEAAQAAKSTVAAQGADESGDFDKSAHHALARKAVGESAVLLKNDDNILPLKEGTRVALIGDFAFEPRYQGAGSSMVNATALEKMVDLIESTGLIVIGRSKGYIRTGQADTVLEKEAVDLAQNADVVLYCFGSDAVLLQRTYPAGGR